MPTFKEIVPLSLSVMTAMMTISPVQAARFIPGQESEFLVGGGSASQILDLAIPGSGRFNVTFEFGSFNQIWGNINDPRDVNGLPPAFWQVSSPLAVDVVDAINNFLNSLNPVPTQLVGRNLDPFLIEFNFFFGASQSFAIPQEPDGMTDNLLFAQGLYSDNDISWTNPTAQQLNTIGSDIPQLYARFQQVPEPSGIVGMVLAGLSLFIIKSKSSEADIED